MREGVDCNSKGLEVKSCITEWDKKQRRAFQNITTGFKVGKRQNEMIRFLTLTTSDIQSQNVNYDIAQLNESVRKLKQRIKRLTVLKLIRLGYLKNSDIRRFYPNTRLNKNFKYEYFRIRTNEGNGVAHIVFKGEYIPYVWLVDNWLDLHNSWNVDIRLIKKDFKRQSRYIVSQYLSNQGTSYVRSSQSWGWIIRAYRQTWYHFLEIMHSKYFYNPIQKRFYRKNKRYKFGESGLTDPPTMGIEVDIFKEWDSYLFNLINIQNSPKQTRLSVWRQCA